jgi:hypothetical protein
VCDLTVRNACVSTEAIERISARERGRRGSGREWDFKGGERTRKRENSRVDLDKIYKASEFAVVR